MKERGREKVREKDKDKVETRKEKVKEKDKVKVEKSEASTWHSNDVILKAKVEAEEETKGSIRVNPHRHHPRGRNIHNKSESDVAAHAYVQLCDYYIKARVIFYCFALVHHITLHHLYSMLLKLSPTHFTLFDVFPFI
jgi:hypothetical protein